jgi:hypothetical protein
MKTKITPIFLLYYGCDDCETKLLVTRVDIPGEGQPFMVLTMTDGEKTISLISTTGNAMSFAEAVESLGIVPRKLIKSTPEEEWPEKARSFITRTVKAIEQLAKESTLHGRPISFSEN